MKKRELVLFSCCLTLLLTTEAAQALTLRECLDLARAGNPSLRVVRHETARAETLVTQARSGYLPNIDGRVGYTVQAEAQAIVSRSGAQETQDERYRTASVTVDQVLYDFGRTGGRVATAEAQSSTATATVFGTEQEIFLQTVQAYYRVLEMRRQYETALAEVASVEDHLRVVKGMFEEGMVTRNDLLQAEVRLATSGQQQLEWENQHENAWLQLDYLIGQSSAYRAELDDQALDDPNLPVVEDLAATLASRPDLLAAKSRIEATVAESRTVRAQFLPQLYARGEVNYVENSHVREQTIYAATIGLRCNFFDGFASTSSLRRTLDEEAQLRDQLNELKQRAELEYRTAGNNLRVAEARIKSLEAATAQAEENLRINRERYREQVGTATEVLDAQALLTQTVGNYNRAFFDRAVARATVLKALGKL